MRGFYINHAKEQAMIEETPRQDSSSRLTDVFRESDGFSLFELMISLAILTVSILALLSLTITSIQANLQNDIRNASIRLTNQTAEILLAQPIETLTTCGLHAEPVDINTNPAAAAPYYTASYTYSVTNGCLEGAGALYSRYPNPVQTIRGTRSHSYNITWTVTNLTNDLRQADISVEYFYNGREIRNQAVIYKHRAI